jgi:hypothetical protein
MAPTALPVGAASTPSATDWTASKRQSTATVSAAHIESVVRSYIDRRSHALARTQPQYHQLVVNYAGECEGDTVCIQVAHYIGIEEMHNNWQLRGDRHQVSAGADRERHPPRTLLYGEPGVLVRGLR